MNQKKKSHLRMYNCTHKMQTFSIRSVFQPDLQRSAVLFDKLLFDTHGVYVSVSIFQ